MVSEPSRGRLDGRGEAACAESIRTSEAKIFPFVRLPARAALAPPRSRRILTLIMRARRSCAGGWFHAMITITEKAATKVKEIADAEALHGQGLRLRVVGGGCSGFSYDLYFEDKPTDMDETFECNGVQLFVDPLSYQYLEGTEIDYVEGLHGSGFKFGNPNVKGTCGCGSSFSA